MQIILWIAVAIVAILLLAVLTMFMGRGHLDEHNSQSQHLDEIEIFSRNFHF